MKKKGIEKQIKKQLKDLGPKIKKVKSELKKLKRKGKTQLKKWEPKVGQFKTEAIQTSVEAKTNFLKLLKEYQLKEKDLINKFNVYKKSSESALKDLKDGLGDISKDLSSTFKKISGHFK